MLCEREETRSQSDDWVVNEAMDSHCLQTGGTFTNVLTRKLDEVVISCLSETIGFVDRDCNLNLLQTPFTNIWLSIFSSKRVAEILNFTGNKKVLIVDDNFTCKFPFFWLVKELIDSYCDSAIKDGGNFCF